MSFFSVQGQEMNKESNVMSETYRKLWNSEVQARIDQDIEKYRKGDAVIEIVGKNGKTGYRRNC